MKLVSPEVTNHIHNCVVIYPKDQAVFIIIKHFQIISLVLLSFTKWVCVTMAIFSEASWCDHGLNTGWKSLHFQGEQKCTTYGDLDTICPGQTFFTSDANTLSVEKLCVYQNEPGQILVGTNPHTRGRTNSFRTDSSKWTQCTGTWVNTVQLSWLKRNV